MESSRPITLEELLASRDNRRAKQLALLAANPGKTLAVATVVIPGNVKRCADSLAIAHAACEAIEERLAGKIASVEKADLPTGFEAYYVIEGTPSDIKLTTSAIEDTHPLGRLMDIDVVDASGNQVSRCANGAPQRLCLLCQQPARVCMRAFTHTQEELKQEIHRRVCAYLDSKH